MEPVHEVLEEDHDLSNFKSVIISYFKEKNFTIDIKPTNGGEQITLNQIQMKMVNRVP